MADLVRPADHLLGDATDHLRYGPWRDATLLHGALGGSDDARHRTGCRGALAAHQGTGRLGRAAYQLPPLLLRQPRHIRHRTAHGQASDDPHRAYAGGRPSTTILLDALTPQSFGALLALYEHSVYLQSVVWGINAFDQFGVELGKQVASRLLPALAGDAQADDPVTRELLAQLR